MHLNSIVKHVCFAFRSLASAYWIIQSWCLHRGKWIDEVLASELYLRAHHSSLFNYQGTNALLDQYLEWCDAHFWHIVLQPNEYLGVAEKAASFIKSKLYDSSIHRLQHSFRNGPSKAPGFLDDYAFLISGLLDLYEFGGRTDWLSWAIELQATQASK